MLEDLAQGKESTNLETLLEFLLLLVNDSESEIDLVGLLEVRLHAHDLRERLLGMLQGAITIIEDAYTVPQLGLLQRVRTINADRLRFLTLGLGR